MTCNEANLHYLKNPAKLGVTLLMLVLVGFIWNDKERWGLDDSQSSWWALFGKHNKTWCYTGHARVGGLYLE